MVTGSEKDELHCDHSVCGRTQGTNLQSPSPMRIHSAENPCDSHFAGGDRWRSPIHNPQCIETSMRPLPCEPSFPSLPRAFTLAPAGRDEPVAEANKTRGIATVVFQMYRPR